MIAVGSLVRKGPGIIIRAKPCIPCIASRDEKRKRSRDEDENGEAHVVMCEVGYTKGGDGK